MSGCGQKIGTGKERKRCGETGRKQKREMKCEVEDKDRADRELRSSNGHVEVLLREGVLGRRSVLLPNTINTLLLSGNKCCGCLAKS